MAEKDMAQKIKELRLARNMTLEQVANIVGVGKSTVRKWETGMIANMRRDKIATLAKALGTTPAYLMGWDDESMEIEKTEELDHVYLSFAKEAQENEIDPEDIKLAIETIKRLREK